MNDDHMTAEISDALAIAVADRSNNELTYISCILDDSIKQLSKEESEYPEDGPKGRYCDQSIPQSALWMSELYYVIFPDNEKDKDILTKHNWPKDTVDKIKETCKAIKDKRNEIAHHQTKTRMVHAHLQESFILELQERNFIISEQDKSNLKQLFNFLKNCKFT